ncbi:MAG: GNAT family N-acetyltransferase [Ignavibacteria bacterium]|nr:GNAT family N-acetyltransferase [Ignavibacteria bacterium]
MAYSLKTFTRLDELDSIKAAWMDFAVNRDEPKMVENDFEYFRFQVSEGMIIGDPLVFALFDDEKPVLITSGRIETTNFSPSIAYFKLNFIRMKKKCYHIYPYGIFDNISSEVTVHNFIKSVIPVLKEKDIDYIFFNLMHRHTELSKYLLNFRNQMMRDLIPSFEDHSILQLPADFESFINSRNTNSRQKFRRLMRRVEKDSINKTVIKVFTDVNDIENFFNEAEQIAQKSQLRAINVGFKSTPDELKQKQWLAAKGYIRGYILYVNDIPCSFLLCNNYMRTFLLEYTGIRTDYEKNQLGTYLYLKMIEDVINSRLADTIDFTHGSDLYKKILSSGNIEDLRIRLYIPKASNIFFIANVTFNTLINKWSRSLLRNTGLYDKLRRTVRKKLKNKIESEKQI